jgi:uncharacterized protein (UPF0335 family)
MEAGGNSADKELRLFVDRIENVEKEMLDLRDDRKDIYAEAKSKGYDAKTIRTLIAIRKLEPAVYRQQRDLLDTYLAAFGID